MKLNQNFQRGKRSQKKFPLCGGGGWGGKQDGHFTNYTIEKTTEET